MASTGQIVAWTSLVLLLFITTFGVMSFLFIITLAVCTLGGVFLAIDKTVLVNNEKRRFTFPYRRSYWQLIASESEPSVTRTNHSITGEASIDSEIESLLQIVYRDFVHTWYDQISSNDQFIHQLDSLVKQTLRNLSFKFRSIQTVPFLTTKLVDVFASHLRLYRLSLETQSTLKLEDPNVNLLSCFFDLELHQEEHHLCRDLVSEDNEHLFTYLTALSDTLLYLLIPMDSFNNRLFHSFLLSLFVNTLAYPLLNLLSNPDFINRLIILLCSSRTGECITLESFLLIVKTSDSYDELSSLRENVEEECTILRSCDTGGTDDQEIKQQLNSLSYLNNVITGRMKKIKDGSLVCEDDLSECIAAASLADSVKYAEFKKNPGKLINIPFEVILKNNVALSHFIEYMSSIGSQGYVFFYLNVEAFKSSVEQLTLAAAEENTKVNLEFLRSPAINIYDTYLCREKLSSQKLVVNEELVEKVRQKLVVKKEPIVEDIFDEVAHVTYTIMRDRETFYPSFQRSIGYIKMLEDLDMLRLPSTVSSESSESTTNSSVDASAEADESSDTFSTLEFLDSDSSVSSSVPQAKPWITAEIDSTGVVREFGTCYAVYAISVTLRRECGKEDKWCCLRRYSDFFTFHSDTLNKYPQLSRLTLSAKRTLASNLSQEFLEQRRHLLNSYLQQLIRILLNRRDLVNFKEHMLTFLQPMTYEKADDKNIVTASVAKAMDKLVINPFKSMGDAMKSGSNQIKGKLSKLSSLGDTIKGTVGTVMSQASSDSGQGSRANSITSQASSSNHSNSCATVQHLNVPGISSLSTSASCSSIASNASSAVDSSKVSSVLDLDSEDNIPLRIMLLLMDEVFDLKSKNLWLRRRIIAVVRQLIHATSGDAINKRIVDKVEELTSPVSIASYIRLFRKSLLPSMKINTESHERSHSTKMVTKIIAKSCLISLVSDDLKHIIGSETSKRGILRVFAMFQNEILNRRLVIVLLESLLIELFPQNKMKDIFIKLHSCSNRKSDDNQIHTHQWPPFLSKFLSSAEEIKSLQGELRMVACSQASSIASMSSRGGSPVHSASRKKS